MKHPYTTLAAAVVVATALVDPANAILINAKGTGITYNLIEATTADPATDRYTLTITGINAATDTEGGRTGVDAIALEKPTNFVSATMIDPATGFVTLSGGLNAKGCDGASAAFFCFDNTLISEKADPPGVPTVPFAPNSTLTFVFDITAGSQADFATYNPAFKINWVGSKNNYDLISLTIGINGGTPGQQCATPPCDVTVVPEPASLSLLAAPGAALFIGGLLLHRRRRDTMS
jgi:hypothetical protein